MSLTNPKNVVTEERLNEYHQTILPYLGGMPDVLANKFSRSDLYSTDEKMIGRWTDGKPLYQKTFIGNFTPSTAQRVYTQLADLSSLNIDKPTNCNGVVKEQSGYFKFLNVSDKGDAAVYTIVITDDKKLSILTSGTNEQTDYIITLQYTKTTDSPVEIGIDTDYSTDEKIIGTWIDGKPLYQKTIISTAQVGWFDIPHNIANVDKVLDAQIGFIHSNAYYKIGCAYSSDAMSASTVGRTNIGIYNSVSAYDGDEVIATIKYTKTTN